MAPHGRAEVEAAFQRYWQLGPLDGNWDAWADLFTEDALYLEPACGTLRGPAAIRSMMRQLTTRNPDLRTLLEWHMIEGDRVVFYMQNRYDNPDPEGAPFVFPGISILEYAGEGLWRRQEDFYSAERARECRAKYDAARRAPL